MRRFKTKFNVDTYMRYLQEQEKDTLAERESERKELHYLMSTFGMYTPDMGTRHTHLTRAGW